MVICILRGDDRRRQETMMAIIEVNLAGFRFLHDDRRGWQVKHPFPRLHIRRSAPRVRVA